MSESVTSETTVHPAKTLRENVDTLLANAGTQVVERVKNRLVEAEVEKRTKLVLDGLVKRDEASKNLNKIKPDQTSFDADGKKVSETYTKAKIDERKKALETLAQIDKALEDALSEKPNYEKLTKLVGGGGNKETPAE